MFKVFNESHDDFKNYYIATYFLRSKTTLRDATWALAIGQSVGNPNNRSEFETDELFQKHSCVILHDESYLKKLDKGTVKIAFPVANIEFSTDGISQILVQTMGGQMDIDIILECHLLDIKFPTSILTHFKGPKIGLKQIREYCNIPKNQVILGGITKPKIGLTPETHLELVKKLIDGGCNFIKEDEILSGASHCPLEKRVELVANYIRDTNSKVFYCASIHSDGMELYRRVKIVHECGGNGVHVNFHCGLGVYREIRNMDLPILVHFQKSGDRLLNHTTHQYRIDPYLIFKLVGLSGCGTQHVGMIGGYLDSEEKQILRIIDYLTSINCVPALSCGMHPGLVDSIVNKVGHTNWMANVGGAITSHPMGTEAGAKAMKQAITKKYGDEYDVAIKKWGKM